MKHQKYVRECAQQPASARASSSGSSLVAAIWEDFAHVMRGPPDPAAEEAALTRHAGNHAELGNGPLWWNSVAAQNRKDCLRCFFAFSRVSHATCRCVCSLDLV